MLGIIAGLALAASVLVSAPAGAEAVARTEPAVGAPAVVWDETTQVQRQVSAADAERIISEYWTADRLASAIPADHAAGTTTGTPTSTQSAETVVAASPAPALAGPDMSTQDAWFSYTNGKVYFRNPQNGGNYTCSGGAVNSNSKRVVVTAGHCVHSGGSGGAWMQNWVFIPGYSRGWQPRGQFPAYYFWSSSGWTVNGDWQRDFAFVVTHNNASGQRVVDAAGGHGLVLNSGYNLFLHIAGYPGNKDGGEVQWYCWRTSDQWPGSSAHRMVGCDFGGGASGGPWLRDYQPNGLGYVVSNTQGILSGNNSGPYYDNHTGDVFNAAKDMSP